MDKEVREIMGNPTIFDDKVIFGGDAVKPPVIVEGVGEDIVLSKAETEMLQLGPKFCLYKNLCEEEFEADVEECLMKVRWDLMGDDDKPEPDVVNIAWEIALGKEACNEIDEEIEEEKEIVEAEGRCIFDFRNKTMNLAKRRATDVKRNSRVIFPKKARSVEEESAMQTLRMELLTLFRQYTSEKCGKNGNQKGNLTKLQAEGLKSLKKRVKEGELVVIPTDKSGNLAVMTRKTYVESGMSHTRKDRGVGWEAVKNSQRELNGHVSMLIKIFKIGSYWKHSLRVRESMMGEGCAVCPLSLLFKDHKGWTASMGTLPPTRPVAGGHLGINLHISEIVSDILDPVVGEYVGGREIISAEDMVAQVEILNDENSNWTTTSYWGGLVEGEYRACTVCVGEEEFGWDDEDPELCCCEEDDGVDEEGRVLITQRGMMNLRRVRWECRVDYCEEDEDRVYSSGEVLPEDIQDQTTPMVVIGTDVVNLYPSLDITKVVEVVKEAILDIGISFDEVDYLEASRYVALNWSEAECQKSGLRRVLPRRRYRTGTRPGLTGEGPLGYQRGDQEQWIFPSVTLTQEEKRLLLATVIELATKAMFTHHYYGFAGKMFQQLEGGPIGLRGTCTIARLCMQVFDRIWWDKVEKQGVNIALYMRYMDDGRKFLHPIKRGWRWHDNALKFCLKWQKEDSSKSPLEVTVDVLRETVRGIASYLEFTFETGHDYSDDWLPTLDLSLLVDGRNQVNYRYFEKPTTTNTTLRKDTAMNENAKIQCLSNDMVRRLLNTRIELPPCYREEVVDWYGKKLMTSGYDRVQTKRILLSGMKGYLNKVKRRQQGGRRRVHDTAKESIGRRVRKKLLGRTSWYKGRKSKKEESKATGNRGTKRHRGESPPKTRAVLFIEQTPGGELSRRIKELLQRLEPTLGYSVRVVERTGRSVQSVFSQPALWQGLRCERSECVTCNQEGEEVPECTRSGIVYESVCIDCNPSATRRGELKDPESSKPTLYVGESSRTIQERASEHWGAAKRGDDRSHMVKHQTMEHGGKDPRFMFKIVAAPRTALSRQIREAVRIRRRGGAGSILNSRSEFNRCYIPRLVVEEEEEEAKKLRLQREEQELDELTKRLELEDMTWEERKRIEQTIAKKKRRRESDTQGEEDRQVGERRKSKKLRFSRIGEEWGAKTVGNLEVVEENRLIEDEQENRPGSLVVHLNWAPRSNKRKVPTHDLISTSITDYFTPKRMKCVEESSVTRELDCEEQDSWEQLAEDVMIAVETQSQVAPGTQQRMVDKYTVPEMKCQEQTIPRLVRGGEEDDKVEPWGGDGSWEGFADESMTTVEKQSLTNIEDQKRMVAKYKVPDLRNQEQTSPRLVRGEEVQFEEFDTDEDWEEIADASLSYLEVTGHCNPSRPVRPAKTLGEDDRKFGEDDLGHRKEDDMVENDVPDSPPHSNDGGYPPRPLIPTEGEKEEDTNVPDQRVRLVGGRGLDGPQSSGYNTRHGLVTPVRLSLITAGQAGHEGPNLLSDGGPFEESMCNDDILGPSTPQPATTVRREMMMNCKDDDSPTAGVCPVIPDRYSAHAVTSTPVPSMVGGNNHKEPTDKLSPISNTKVCKVTGARRKGDECLDVKDGMCLDHGGKAQQKWRLEWKTEKDAMGNDTKVKTRRYYWVCAFRKDERWSQTVLSFAGTARRDTIKTPDTTQGRGGDTE